MTNMAKFLRKKWLAGMVLAILLAALTVAIPKLVKLIDGIAIPFTGLPLVDISASFVMFSVAAIFCGIVIEWETFQEFARDYFSRIPIVGGIMLLFVLPKEEFRLAEIMTVPGAYPNGGCWEYAVIVKSWREDDAVWYRVHTLGWTGKLFARVGASHVRHIDTSGKEILLTVATFGLL